MQVLFYPPCKVIVRGGVFLKSIFCIILIGVLVTKSFAETSTRALLDELARMSIEELIEMPVDTVYSASRFMQKIPTAPSSVTIITREEIKRYGYRNLAEVLRKARGFYLSYDRNYHYLGVRGFSRPGDYNTRVLLMIDGHRVNDSIFLNSPVGTEFPLDIDLIEKIEIVRGPSSSLYGTNAFFAVVNIITRNINGIETSLEAGSQQTYRGRISYGGNLKKDLSLIVSGSYYESKGDKRIYFKEFDSPENNNGVAEDLDYDRAKSMFWKLQAKSFKIEALYSKRKKGVPTASYGSAFNDQNYYTEEEYFFIDLNYDFKFNKKSSLNTRVSYNYFYDFGSYPFNDTSGTNNIIINREYSKALWLDLEATYVYKADRRHRIILGGEFLKNLKQKQMNYDLATYLDDERHLYSWGVFFQDEYRPFKRLTVNMGIRYDYYETFGSTVNPRVALIVSLTKDTYLKMLYGKAFRAPSVYELYYRDEDTQKANASLRPEKIDTYEAVLEKYFNKDFKAIISAYYYRIKDLINLRKDPADGLLFFDNIDRVKSQGIEFELQGKYNGFSGIFSYSYQETRDVRTDRLLSNSPLHLAKIHLSLPVYKTKVFASLEMIYNSKRKTLTDEYTPSFLLTNLTLYSGELLKNLEVSMGIYNLFDKRYYYPASEEHLQSTIAQDGRLFKVKVVYTLN